MATRSCREKAQKLNEQHQLILSKLLREEDNKYCADCEAKGSADVPFSGPGLLPPVTFPWPRCPGPERRRRLRPVGPGPEGRAGAGLQWTLTSAQNGGEVRPTDAVPASAPTRPRGLSPVPASRSSDPAQGRGGAGRGGSRSADPAPAWAVLGVKGLPFSRRGSQVPLWVRLPLSLLPRNFLLPPPAPMLGIPGGTLPACPPTRQLLYGAFASAS